MREFLSTFFFFYRHEVKDGRFSVNQSQNKFEIVKLKCNELSLKADDCEKRKKTNKQAKSVWTFIPFASQIFISFLLEIFRSFVFAKNAKIGTSSSRSICD